MHEFAFFNDQILQLDKIKINAISTAALYGKGIFTTLAIFNAKPFLWEKHWNRLNDNAARIGLNLSDFEREQVYQITESLIGKNKVSNGRCRVTFFDESSSKIWQIGSKNKTSLSIQTGDQRKVKQSISLAVSPFPVNSKSPLVGVKSCNYLEQILALENAKSNDFDEAVRLNEKGKIVSGCMANIFWIKDKKLFTPSLETGCLAGTTREFILEKAEVEEIEAEVKVLQNADAVFLTSSGVGILKVSSLQTKNFDQQFDLSAAHKTIQNLKSRIQNY